MPDYSKGKIYRLYTDSHFYIGSTCVPLPVRFLEHKRHAALYPDYARYIEFNKTGWANVKIELLKDCPCQSRDELLKHEDDELRKYLGSLGCVNVVYAVRDPEATKSWMRRYGKEYYEKNKERVLARQKSRYDTNNDTFKIKHTCEVCGGKYTTKNKNHHEKTQKHKNKVNVGEQ
jgi:hypothetical protein